jgi:hypothetical protein
MKLVMTLMVRDEVDIVAAMIEHHLAQGVDLIIATDNASVDGTRELLASYAETGRLELHDYLEHDKRQFAVVTGMAQRAYTVHGADWVINADADEFFVPVDRSLTLKAALEQIPASLGSFFAPVVNMTGYPAKSGAGIARLRWRDVRDEETLMRVAGLHAQPTPNAIHIGDADVAVVQGNHSTSIRSAGQPDPAFAIEVLHLPWRSWNQFGTKVEISGRAYEGNPNLNPSPRHHGMRDYRFHKAGVLEHFYVYRHPNVAAAGKRGLPTTEFVEDDWLAGQLRGLLEAEVAVRPEALSAVLDDDGAESDYPKTAWTKAAEIVGYVLPLETERTESLQKAINERNLARKRLQKARWRNDKLKAQLAATPQARLKRAVKAGVARLPEPLKRPLRAVKGSK